MLVALFCCGFIPQHKAARQTTPKKSVSELYSEAIKAVTIHKDTINALCAIEAIFQQDSTYAPALNLLSRITRVRQVFPLFLSNILLFIILKERALF